MQRQVSPIPPGRYWICVLGATKQGEFDQWIRDMRGAVVVETASLNDQEPSTQFVIFRVPEGRAPFLDSQYFGFPNFAADNVHSLEDVEQSPYADVPEPFSAAQASEWLPNLSGMGTIVLLVCAALLLGKK